jgi:hypothetical protein
MSLVGPIAMLYFSDVSTLRPHGLRGETIPVESGR